MRLEKGMGIRLARRGLFKEKGHTIELMDHLVGGRGKGGKEQKEYFSSLAFFPSLSFLTPITQLENGISYYKDMVEKGGKGNNKVALLT